MNLQVVKKELIGVISMTRNIVGVVLAGGESKRFGSPKAFAKKDDIPFYQYSVEAIAPFVRTTMIVTNPKLHPLFAERERSTQVVMDHEDYLAQGPLAGIYTAMDIVNADWYMVIPIDVPFAKASVFDLLTNYMGEGVDAIVPEVNNKKQPLFALYHHSMKKDIKNQLDRGERSLHQLLKDKQVIYVPMKEDKAFTNINWKKDYQRLVQTEDESS
jgi:molybdopterin-guanine dinucleotide biosynthesis protein A